MSKDEQHARDDTAEPTVQQSAAMLRGDAPAPRTADPLLGRTIGHFTIKRLIGQGGMGAVYEAQQQTPRRVVALKMMRAGITSRSALRRFQYEVQTLARLRHAGIAQIYEAGTTDVGEGGLPWFAMEYIAGAKPLTRYAVEKKLSIRERLALFARICDAAHHGHQKGIIHRDLKPGNILVTSSGDPKIIDFGVARSTDSDMAVTTLQTDVGALIGTLQYMSPEQCAADPHDIDIRSDVYALGMVLFELLTESRPYDVSNQAIHEAARIVREDPPTRPSTIDRVLRGDIETICLKALEKDRDRRFQSAVEFRQDIEHYLAGDPISARRPTLFYHLTLIYRRHRASVVLSAMLLVLLAVGLVSFTWQAAAAEEARRYAARSQAIINGVERVLAPHREGGEAFDGDVTLKQVLDYGMDNIISMRADVASSESATDYAYFCLVFANSYQSIGAIDKARILVDQAMEILGEWFSPKHPSLHDARIMDVLISFAQGRTVYGMRAGRELLREKADLLGPHDVDTLGSAWSFAYDIARKGHADVATQLIGELVEDMTWEDIRSSPEALDAVYFLAEAHTDTVPPTLMMIIDRIGPENASQLEPWPIALINNLAWEVGVTGGHPAYALSVLERIRPALEHDKPNDEARRFNRIYRGEMLRLLGRHDESAQLLEQQVAMDRDDAGVSAARRGYAREKLAETWEAMGRSDDAAALRAGG